MENSADEPERIDYHPPATWESDYQVLKSMIFTDLNGATQVKLMNHNEIRDMFICC